MSTITGAKAKDQFRPGSNQGQESTIDKAKDMAEKAKDAITSTVSDAADQASHFASTVAQKADHLASSAGASVKGLGETIREKGPQEGPLGNATKAVGNTIERGGKYLEDAGLSGIVEDLTDVVRRNPIPAVLVGLGLGVLLSRALRS